MHRAFAEGIGTHQDAAFLVLQGTGDDFRRRGAAAVDQHHQWHAFAGVCRVGREAQFGVGDAAFGVDDQALGKEMIRHLHSRLQHAARVVAQVENQAAHLLAVVFAEFGQRLADLVTGLDLELGDADITVAVFQHLRLDALDLNGRPRQRYVKRRAAIAHQRQRDFLADLAAHLVDRFLHVLSLGRRAIDLHDQVACLNAGLGGGGVVDGRNHLDQAVFDAHFDAQTTEFAAGAFLQLLEILRAEVGRVRIKVAEHALDRVFQQRFVVHRLDVGSFDPIHDLGKGPQLVKRQRRLGVGIGFGGCDCCRRGWRGFFGSLRQGRADNDGNCQGQRGEAGQMQHV